MAHSDATKAKALALLMVGNTPRYVAHETGVPLTTVKRWRNKELPQWMREIFGPNFGGSLKMALKKRLAAKVI